MVENFYTNNEYFASANGYYGFKSYFSEVFNSSKFEKIYVLKGGPGTGKSSLIKRIGAFCKSQKIYYEIYRCSSDPDSLDGIIINHKNKKIAMLDGTAPHQRDPEIPGAIDELINLGDAWDKNALKKQRDTIIQLNDKKGKCYAKAYEYLKYSSVFATNIKAEITSLIDFDTAEKECDRLIDKVFKTDCTQCGIKLISSFSKYGYKTLSGPFDNSKTNYSIYGRFGSDKIFISMLVQKLSKKGVGFYNIPSPLDSTLSEGILTDNGNTIVFGMGNGEMLFDTTPLIKIEDIAEFEHKMVTLKNNKEYYLNMAADELKSASLYHFMLEDIYTPAMNFEIVEKIYNKILTEIKNIYLS